MLQKFVNSISLCKSSSKEWKGRLYYLLTWTILSLCLCGCKEEEIIENDELSDKEYITGVQRIREGNENTALSSFLMVISKRKKAPNSHLHVGRIYLDKHNDPIYAIYHFREYLSQTENTKEAAIVKQLINTAKKKFIRSLPGHHCELDAHVELVEIAKHLREENVALKRKLREMQEKCSPNTKKNEFAPVVQNSVISTGFVKHIVRVGDTLSKISQKYYGTSVHWKKIFEANQEAIPFPNALTVGQELVIP
ncbi:MAG: LysM peptidoglycan-binding domain-containing protein [Puniceicoccales bacterium]|nr:LysM peptidoglycan-binding domain-containing protein [Puniceicoccales bacterium]